MKGQRYRVTKDYIYSIKTEDNKKMGRGLLKEGVIVTVIGIEKRRGVIFCKIDHSIGWVGANNKIWNVLEIIG